MFLRYFNADYEKGSLSKKRQTSKVQLRIIMHVHKELKVQKLAVKAISHGFFKFFALNASWVIMPLKQSSDG